MSIKKLKAINQLRPKQHDIVAIGVDGKTFADDEMVITICIAIEGTKLFIAFIQTAAEHTSVSKDFIRSLIDRKFLYYPACGTVICN